MRVSYAFELGSYSRNELRVIINMVLLRGTIVNRGPNIVSENG